MLRTGRYACTGISLQVVYVLNMVKNSDSREDGYWPVCLNRAGKELQPLKITNEALKKEVLR